MYKYCSISKNPSVYLHESAEFLPAQYTKSIQSKSIHAIKYYIFEVLLLVHGHVNCHLLLELVKEELI